MKKISKLIILFTILLFADNHHNNKDTKAVLNYFTGSISPDMELLLYALSP